MAEYSNNILIYYTGWFEKSDVGFLQTLKMDKAMKELSDRYLLDNSVIVNKGLVWCKRM